MTIDPKAIFERESGKKNSNSFTLRNSIPAYAIAVLPLITPVPIQEVNLFDYAVAHKSVNSSYGLTANADDYPLKADLEELREELRNYHPMK